MGIKFLNAFIFLLLFGFISYGCKKDSSLDPEEKPEKKPTINVKFLGHSSFLITTPDSLRIVTDPYGNTVSFLLWPDTVKANIVTISHSHADHNQSGFVKGHPIILKDGKVDTIGSVQISAFETQHGKLGTQQMGNNWIYIFQIGDIKLVHLGETGTFANPVIFNAIKDADVIFIPTGGAASLSFEEIKNLIDETNPRLIIPHHFSPNTQQRYYGSSTADEFVNFIQPNIAVNHSDFLDVTSKMDKQIVVLKALFSK